MSRRFLARLLCSSTLSIAVAGCSNSQAPQAALEQAAALASSMGTGSFAVYHNANQIPRRDVFELTIAKTIDYGTQENFWDVELRVDFAGPAGSQPVSVKGFYFDTLPNGQSLWKCRFAPGTVGNWDYQFTLTHVPSGTTDAGAGSFQCVAGSNPGFVRVNPANSARWITEDGKAFFPMGLYRDGFLDGGETTGAFGQNGVVGERFEDSIAQFAASGFNMFRFGQLGKQSFICMDDPNVSGDGICEAYLKESSIKMDDQIEACRKNGVKVCLDMFGNRYDDGQFPGALSAANKRMIEYLVNRWSAQVDIWILCNEREPGVAWLTQAANYLHQIDPNNHPASNTYYPEPGYAWSSSLPYDFTAPHWFEDESEFSSDSRVATLVQHWKSYGRAVLIGCQGNMGGKAWRPDSTLRMRIRSWAFLFTEAGIIYNSWGITDDWTGPPSNIYIGRKERQYMQILQRFVQATLQPDTVVENVSVSSPSSIRAYALASSQTAAAYVHRYASHTGTQSGLSITLHVPAAGNGYWIDPSNGQLVGTPIAVHTGSNTVSMPPIGVDLAFFTSATPLNLAPIANCTVTNSQWTTTKNYDLDGTGQPDYCPAHPAYGAAPLTLTFNASESRDWDGGALSYAWNFGDGSQGSGVSVNHTYTNRGNYIATLTVTDDEGQQASHGFAVRVTADPHPGSNDAPQFHKQPILIAHEGEAICFTPKAWDRERNGGSYANDPLQASYHSATNLPANAIFAQLPFDGTIDVNSVFPPKDFYWVPDFNQAGNYTVSFQVHDGAGAAATPLQVQIQVLDSPEIPASGGSMGVTAYGTGKTNSLGTIPSLSWTGTPSVAGGNFSIAVSNAVPQQTGYLFFGQHQTNVPFQGGTLYTSGSIRRMGAKTLDAVGSASTTIPMNTAMIGVTQYFQFYFDDPNHADGTGAGLSNALQVTFGP